MRDNHYLSTNPGTADTLAIAAVTLALLAVGATFLAALVWGVVL